MKITTEHLKARKLDMLGFVVLPRVMPDDMLNRYERKIAPVVQQPNPPGKFTFIHLDPVDFTWILSHEVVMGLVQFFCGDYARVDNHFGICYPGEGLVPNVHGGPFSEQRSVYYTSQAGVWQTSNLKIAIPLQDQDGTVFVPGSHKTDMPVRTGPTSPHELERPFLQRGDVLMFTDALVHGTAHVEQPRQMLYFTLTPGHVAWSLYNEPPWRDELPVARRRLFRPPGLFDINKADRAVTKKMLPSF